MKDNDVLNPIAEQIDYWIAYKQNSPDYTKDPKGNRAFRLANDRDCVLTNGNILADTIFSLWNPLKRVLIHLNPNSGITVFSKQVQVLNKIKNKLPEYLPPEHSMVIALSNLFVLGKTRANVMILPPGNINQKRGSAPYFDYIPHFLHDCFRPNANPYFEEFSSNEELKDWIEKENLEMFFVGEIARENILDLLNCGSVKSPTTYNEEHIHSMLFMYTKVLLERQRFYPK